ncbi:uncharacterized protein LOC143679374 [Tamandua tetradactyla]|uniref:uncharacterized protein LOC143679374 n=1 Tax=Tamandua tetradactyla TaxID=48850 RepID=UPI004053BFB8
MKFSSTKGPKEQGKKCHHGQAPGEANCMAALHAPHPAGGERQICAAKDGGNLRSTFMQPHWHLQKADVSMQWCIESRRKQPQCKPTEVGAQALLCNSCFLIYTAGFKGSSWSGIVFGRLAKG